MTEMAPKTPMTPMTPMAPPSLFVDGLFTRALTELAALDPRLGALIARHGAPPTWQRPPGFATLARLVFEQSVSLAAAAAVWNRMTAVVGEATPAALAALEIEALTGFGLSRAKAVCVRGLAEGALDGSLDLDGVASAPDAAARAHLVARRGIGPWTADVYLMMALGRPDVWPGGDVALREMVARFDGTERPSVREMEARGERWRPWRAMAARVLWASYLSKS